MLIRAAFNSDLPAVVELLQVSYARYLERVTSEDAAKIRAGLSSAGRLGGSGTWIVAEKDRQIVGCVAFFAANTTDSPLFERAWAHIRLLAVAPELRRQGLGRSLTQHCVTLATQSRAGVLALHTSELMVAASRLYESMGFTVNRELPPMFGLRYFLYVLHLPA
jgi:ribosomal protein S18 acetylase RimI-like enzyme